MTRAFTLPAHAAMIVLFMTEGCSINPEGPVRPHSREAEALYRDGTRLLESDTTKAIELLTRSLMLNPDAPPVLYNRASAYASVGRDAEAVVDMRRLEVVAPEVGKQLRDQMKLAAGPYTSLAEDDCKAKNFTAAIKKCDSALAYNPEWGDAWVVKGIAFQGLGDTTKAMESFDKGAEVEPDNFFVFVNRAELHQKEGRLEQAIADFTKAIALQPDNPDGYSGRSSAFAALKTPDKAASDQAKARELAAKAEGRRGLK